MNSECSGAFRCCRERSEGTNQDFPCPERQHSGSDWLRAYPVHVDVAIPPPLSNIAERAIRNIVVQRFVNSFGPSAYGLLSRPYWGAQRVA